MGEENLGDKEEGDYKEGLDIGVERREGEVEDAAMQQRNRWPEGSTASAPSWSCTSPT